MKPIGPRLRNLIFSTGILVAAAIGYWIGYDAAMRDKGPDYRYLMVVRRTPGNPNSVGTSATLYNVRNPINAVRLNREVERLKASGIEYYVTDGVVVESTVRPGPDPRRVNSHR